MYIISVTGTKGKTSIVRFISDILFQNAETVLRVDNDGAYLNNMLLSDRRISSEVYGQTPSVCPGRYFLHVPQESLPTLTAVLETSIGCGGAMGLGYRSHNIGIFTNVFDDHIKPELGLFSKSDIATKKNFIFKNIQHGGTAVCNADDPYVCAQLQYVSSGVTIIPFGETYTHFDLQSHIHSGGVALQKIGDSIVLHSQHGTRILLEVSNLSVTFRGYFTPAVCNVMAVLATLYAYYGTLSDSLLAQVQSYIPASDGGRLALFENAQGVRILIDYAHEEQSLLEVARLSRHLTLPGGNTIAVMRLHPAKTNTTLHTISKSIARCYDMFCLYDVVDGVDISELHTRSGVRTIGETASYVAHQLIESGASNVQVILEEKKAIEYASTVAKKGDVVVIIYKNNPAETKKMVEQNFRITT